MNESLQPSQNCINLTKISEACELVAYLDPARISTIGWGHTDGVQLGMSCTPEQATTWLTEDLAVAASMVYRFVKVPLNQNQFDALVDFVFNVKLVEFMTSTLREKLNLGDYAGAAQEFDRWVFGHLNGVAVKLPGLVTRRAKERELFQRTI